MLSPPHTFKETVVHQHPKGPQQDCASSRSTEPTFQSDQQVSEQQSDIQKKGQGVQASKVTHPVFVQGESQIAMQELIEAARRQLLQASGQKAMASGGAVEWQQEV